MNGYEATVLIDICDAFLQARKEIELSPRQSIIADQCEILIRSFAKVGLIALIDEATGYQYDREEKELQTILKALISDEILEYQQQFQLSFYREIFRLWNIPFTPQNIRRKPQFIGHLTNRFIYQNLPKGIFVLEKLKSKTPKTEKGNYKYRLHQSLTKDKGREALKKVLYSVEALASISKDKREFERLMNEKYGQKEIPFTDLETLDEPKKKEVKLSDFNQKLKQGLGWNPKDHKSD
ncbi:MAG: P63C domain-containing protein [Flavobacteriaceae bacterium]